MCGVVVTAEQLERLAFGGCGESEVTEVAVVSSGGHLGGEQRFAVDLAAVCDVADLFGGQDGLELAGGRAGL